MFYQQYFQDCRPPACTSPATLSLGWQHGYPRLKTKPITPRASNHPCISQSANSKNIPQQRFKLLSPLKTEKLFRSKNSSLLPKSTILKLIQIKNVSGDKAAPVVRKPLSCIENGSMLGPVSQLLSIGSKQRESSTQKQHWIPVCFAARLTTTKIWNWTNFPLTNELIKHSIKSEGTISLP